MPDETEFKRIISAEKQEFRKQLPHLLEKHRGKWVIFKDGKVVEFFNQQDEAYARALDLYGPDEPFLVEEVQEEGTQQLSFSIELGTIYVS